MEFGLKNKKITDAHFDMRLAQSTNPVGKHRQETFDSIRFDLLLYLPGLLSKRVLILLLTENIVVYIYIFVIIVKRERKRNTERKRERERGVEERGEGERGGECVISCDCQYKPECADKYPTSWQ